MPLRRFLIAVFLTLALSQCQGERQLEMHGTMTYVPYKGYQCWLFQADSGRYYEVVTPSDQILKKGMRMYIKASPVEKQTFCGLGDTIEITKFKPDDPNYVPPQENTFLK